MPRDEHMPLEPRTKEQQIAARAEAIRKIHELLKDAPATIGEMYQVVDGLRPTIVGYLRYMHKSLRTVRPTSETRGRSTLWELGADPTLPTPDEEIDSIFATRRGSGPAKQIGMKRDPLIAALFGPANQEHKEAA